MSDGLYIATVILAAVFHGLHEGLVMTAPWDAHSTSTNYGVRFHKWSDDYHMMSALRSMSFGMFAIAWVAMPTTVVSVIFAVVAFWEVNELAQNFARQGSWVYHYNFMEYEHVVVGWWGWVITGRTVIVLHVARTTVAAAALGAMLCV